MVQIRNHLAMSVMVPQGFSKTKAYAEPAEAHITQPLAVGKPKDMGILYHVYRL